jgi:predicted Zn-dependent protease
MSAQELSYQQSQVECIEVRRRGYRGVAGGWPPNVRNESHLAEVRSALLKDIKLARGLMEGNAASLRAREVCADLLRMAHNLHLPGAAQESDAMLQKILAEHPDNYAALVSIASLYITSNPGLVSKADLYFRRALALRPDDPDPLVYQGLGFACLHQKKTDEAIRQFTEYLRLVPDDQRIFTLVAKLAAGDKPSPVHVPMDNGPVPRAQAVAVSGTSKPWWKVW